MNITGTNAQEICGSVRELLRTKILSPGQNLPPIRHLAKELEVNRNTVAAAYRWLVEVGIAESRGRAGTVIRDQQDAGEQEGAAIGTPLVDLASGNPDPALLPELNGVVANLDLPPKLYGGPTVDPDLAAFSRDWFSPDLKSMGDYSLSVTHGAVDAHERLLGAHLAVGDYVAVEDPCFLSSINTLNLNGLRAIPVAVDRSGITTAGLRDALEAGARAVIVTSRAHNPTGVSLTSTRAAELREVLGDFPAVMVIQDDHYSLLAREPFYNIANESTSHWALVRSVSKYFGPDLRLGIVASDPATERIINARLGSGMNWVSHLLQRTVRALLVDSGTQQCLRVASDTYDERATYLVEALACNGIDAVKPDGGMNVWLDLDADTCADDVSEELAAAGWLIRPGSSFTAEATSRRNGVRVTTALVTREIAEEFAVSYASALSRVRSRQSK
ncbi:transcriptional regulator PtsJ (plasmid) [Rhodococcus qingshengii]|uniref:aminotransferase class I/II-fold pyridoxal phosphate-dependent enzyme n=1 Tax=Rhodococcus qingshengii TaxID=334542 RepID=UPI0007E58B2A|nr:aminotransferase class I/II-fold pyridoxal phosphate-dependent enzyme [Rhodococcus qingshengii]BCF86675.1 transcriptional regulator PtsJ [Rhodococcus qingshengii]